MARGQSNSINPLFGTRANLNSVRAEKAKQQEAKAKQAKELLEKEIDFLRIVESVERIRGGYLQDLHRKGTIKLSFTKDRLNRENIIVANTEHQNHFTWYNSQGKFHRLDGPAVEREQQEYWYYRGNLHREGGPAAKDMHQEQWLIHGNLHRIGGPAIIDEYTGEQWYQDGLRHRPDGPARTMTKNDFNSAVFGGEMSELTKWLKANGGIDKQHMENVKNGVFKDWWFEGIRCTRKDHERLSKLWGKKA